MKSAGRGGSAGPAPSRELARLRARLADAENTLLAIRTGEVDAVVVAGQRGPQVFTLQGADQAYRLLIESMNEGALTLTADKTILYANGCFARMVKCPLEKLIGSSLRRFLSEADREMLRPLLKRVDEEGSKIQVFLNADDGSRMPAQVSIRPLPKIDGQDATFGMVVTDMTEARRNEEALRALSHRLVQAGEAERGRVAVELHDHITQLLCAVLIRSQALANALSGRDGPSKREAIKLREMLGTTAEEVERISRNLRPGVLDELGLVAALRGTSKEFANRTGVTVKLAFVELTARLPADTELTLFRILQEALNNVQEHSRAHHVSVRLTKNDEVVQLVIHDDGIGFDPNRAPAARKANGGLGLLSMRERALHVGGALDVRTARRGGTEIDVRIPLATATRASGGSSARSAKPAPSNRAAPRTGRTPAPRR